ncbi:NDR1/HIN1-like protein 12 [Impatiens glandulifera]|uniref:NDR1/HIN1-like protein 12 n=1 Tax=Impatiens glandulifera TaxID=253017 RepID=UPI001FB14A83|nr:NDR1/HIN1-like protein 12 [Impatiens glandulifera]
MAPINKESSRYGIDFPNFDQNRKHNDGTETDPSKSITCLSWALIVKIIVIIIFLIIRFVHPSKPEFIIQDATIFTFNLCTGEPPSSTTLLSSTLQITIASKNQNGLSADIYYHELSIYGEYKNQRVTYETDIPRSYQKNMEDNVWSLFINATNVPISPFNVPFLKQDQLNGIINLTIKLDGNGKFATNDAINGDFLFPSVKYILFKRCSVVTV